MLWQLDNPYIINKLLFATLWKFSDDLDSSDLNLICLTIFNYAIKLRLNEVNGDFLSLKGLLKINDRLASILIYYENIIEGLSHKIAFKNITILDVISMKLNKLAKLLYDNDNLDAVCRIRFLIEKKTLKEIYDYVIFFRIQLALDLKNDLLNSRNVLNDAFKNALRGTQFQTLPFYIMSNIIDNFNTMELKKMYPVRICPPVLYIPPSNHVFIKQTHQ